MIWRRMSTRELTHCAKGHDSGKLQKKKSEKRNRKIVQKTLAHARQGISLGRIEFTPHARIVGDPSQDYVSSVRIESWHRKRQSSVFSPRSSARSRPAAQDLAGMVSRWPKRHGYPPPRDADRIAQHSFVQIVSPRLTLVHVAAPTYVARELFHDPKPVAVQVHWVGALCCVIGEERQKSE